MDRYRQTDNADRPSFTGLAALSFAALGLLIVIKLVAEKNLLPDGDIFRVIIATLLGFLLVETFARVITLLRYYRRDEAAAATVTQPACA